MGYIADFKLNEAFASIGKERCRAQPEVADIARAWISHDRLTQPFVQGIHRDGSDRFRAIGFKLDSVERGRRPQR